LVPSHAKDYAALRDWLTPLVLTMIDPMLGSFRAAGPVIAMADAQCWFF
jgi:hypothetical protein